MNIGTFAKKDNGFIIGKIQTLTLDLNIALKPVASQNPNAPLFEIFALSAARQWVRVGAFFEQTAKGDGTCYLRGTVEDPSLAQPLYITAFRQDDGSYNVVWSRPTRRRDLPAEMAAGDDNLPPLPGEAGTEGPRQADGLGESSAAPAFA